MAFSIIKWAGVAYLLYMAWSTWRDREEIFVEAQPPLSVRRVIVAGITLNLLNPKLTLFFFAFLPQFVPGGEVLPMLGLSAVFMGMTFVVFAAYGVFAASMRDRVLRRRSVMNGLRRVFAATFAGLSVRLAFESR